jgi:hypothetical protein
MAIKNYWAHGKKRLPHVSIDTNIINIGPHYVSRVQLIQDRNILWRKAEKKRLSFFEKERVERRRIRLNLFIWMERFIL